MEQRLRGGGVIELERLLSIGCRHSDRLSIGAAQQGDPDCGSHRLLRFNQLEPAEPHRNGRVEEASAGEGRSARGVLSMASDRLLGNEESCSAHTPLDRPKPQCSHGAARCPAAHRISAFSTGLRPGQRQVGKGVGTNGPQTPCRNRLLKAETVPDDSLIRGGTCAENLDSNGKLPGATSASQRIQARGLWIQEKKQDPPAPILPALVSALVYAPTASNSSPAEAMHRFMKGCWPLVPLWLLMAHSLDSSVSRVEASVTLAQRRRIRRLDYA